MSIIGAFILGVLQGVTAFFPVSSSGHLVVVGRLLGADEAVDLGYLALMHIGTLIAVFVSFRQDLVRVFRALAGMGGDVIANAKVFAKNHRHPEMGDYRRLLTTNYRCLSAMMLVSMIPATVLSLFLRRFARMGADNLLLVAMGMLITALMLMISSFTQDTGRKPAGTRVRDALLIGALQGISVVPGISRLGMIMAGAGICGFARKYLVKYAFLLSIPTIVGGVIVELRADGLSVFRTAGAGPCIIGILTSALVGCFVLEFAKNFLSRKRNRGFACYCLAAGVLTVVIYLI